MPPRQRVWLCGIPSLANNTIMWLFHRCSMMTNGNVGMLWCCAPTPKMDMCTVIASRAPFKLVLVFNRDSNASAGVYESTSGLWGGIVAVVTMGIISSIRANILIGNALYWLFCGGDVLVHDFERQSLGVIEKLIDTQNVHIEYSYKLLIIEDNGLGLTILSKHTIQLWERKSNCDGFVRWMMLKKIAPLKGMFRQIVPHDAMGLSLLGYDEDTNVIVLSTSIGRFMLQLDSMQIRDISIRAKICYPFICPYTNLYVAEKGTWERTAATAQMVNCSTWDLEGTYGDGMNEPHII
ncbi:hypothetical protein VPH35_049871 [Triticum aestivum]